MKKKYIKPIAILGTIFFPVTILFFLGVAIGIILYFLIGMLYYGICSFLRDL